MAFDFPTIIHHPTKHLPQRFFKLTYVCPSIRLLPAFLGIGSLVLMAILKSEGARFSRKKIFGQICYINLKKGFFGQNCYINFSDFRQKDRVQGTLKCGRNNFSRKIFFILNYGFSSFGEILFYHFPISCLSQDWLISFF